MKVTKEGWPFIFGSWAPAVLGLVFGSWVISVLFFVTGLAFAFFFRDPERRVPEGEHFLVSPADGKVIGIEPQASHPFFASPVSRVSIFLSLLDVHITRSPLSAEVIKMESSPGRFWRAFREEASTSNASRSLFLRGEKTDIYLRLIVGVAARRIKCYVKERERIRRGQKIGLMYFGSRVEVYLPSGVRVLVGPGQKIKAGQTIIGEVIE